MTEKLTAGFHRTLYKRVSHYHCASFHVIGLHSEEHWLWHSYHILYDIVSISFILLLRLPSSPECSQVYFGHAPELLSSKVSPPSNIGLPCLASLSASSDRAAHLAPEPKYKWSAWVEGRLYWDSLGFRVGFGQFWFSVKHYSNKLKSTTTPIGDIMGCISIMN